jgi:hypothetical protein
MGDITDFLMGDLPDSYWGDEDDDLEYEPSLENKEFECIVLFETNKAYKVVIGKREMWLPKSYTTLSKDETHITVAGWLRSKKGLY